MHPVYKGLPSVLVTDFDNALDPLHYLARSPALPTLDREAFLDMFFDELQTTGADVDWQSFARDLIYKDYLYEGCDITSEYKEVICHKLVHTSLGLHNVLLKHGLIHQGVMQYVYSGQVSNELYQFVVRPDAQVPYVGHRAASPSF